MIDELRSYMERLFPLPRYLTGEPNRETLRILREIVPLTMIEYPSGMQLYDKWVVPDEWQWGARPLPHEQILGDDGRLDLSKHDGQFVKGGMTVGEYRLKGKYPQEYLVSTYICHPSTANDNLSGMVLTAFLARELSKLELNYSWRFIWVPETIGAIAYLHENEAEMQAIDCGLVVTCVAGPGEIGWKMSFEPGHRLNNIVTTVVDTWAGGDTRYPYDTDGSDERQYSKPGFGINCCSIHSGKYYEYSQYHTKADDLSFISYERMVRMRDIYLRVCLVMDLDLVYLNLQPMCEPKLGERGLYGDDTVDATLALCQWADGTRPLSVIARDTGIGFDKLHGAAKRMVRLGLLKEGAVCKHTLR